MTLAASSEKLTAEMTPFGRSSSTDAAPVSPKMTAQMADASSTTVFVPRSLVVSSDVTLLHCRFLPPVIEEIFDHALLGTFERSEESLHLPHGLFQRVDADAVLVAEQEHLVTDLDAETLPDV